MTVPFDVETAFTTFAGPVSIFSSDGVYVYINPAGEKLLGLTASDLVGKTYLQAFPDLATHPYHQAFMRVAASGTSEVLEFYYEPMDRWSSQQLYSTRGRSSSSGKTSPSESGRRVRSTTRSRSPRRPSDSSD